MRTPDDAEALLAREELVAVALRIALLERSTSDTYPNADAALEAADGQLVEAATRLLAAVAMESARRHPSGVAGRSALQVVPNEGDQG